MMCTTLVSLFMEKVELQVLQSNGRGFFVSRSDGTAHCIISKYLSDASTLFDSV